MRILPISALGRVAVALDAVALVVLVVLGIVGTPLIAVTVGAVLALVAVIRGERALLAWVALALIVVPLLLPVAEITGLIE